MQYTLSHLAPELIAVLINICFSIPAGMSSLMILRYAVRHMTPPPPRPPPKRTLKSPPPLPTNTPRLTHSHT